MYQKYGQSLEKAATTMRNVHLMMMVELVERIWGGGVPHRVSQNELEACGHHGVSLSSMSRGFPQEKQ